MGNTGIIIAGAGQAGFSAAAKLRALGYGGPVTLIGEETIPPYQRPPLSKGYLQGELDRERLLLRPEGFYRDQSITLQLGQPVTGIDIASRTVTAGDDLLPYAHLILATGATPNRLPPAAGGDLGGVFTIRGIADIDAIAPEFQPGRKLVIVGGGYIGLEIAAVASKLGLDVTLIEAADRILKRVAASQTANFFRDLHRRNGVRILEGTQLRRLTGQDRVTGAELASGEVLAADFVVLGVGVKPNTGLAEEAGLRVENGIWTDLSGRTSDPCVWAAGDCASLLYRNSRIRLESVGNAISQAETVAENILGGRREYLPKPWFWSDQFDVKLQIAGLNTGYDRVVSRNTGEGGQSFWYYASDQLLAVDALNDPRAYMTGKKLIETGMSPDPEQVCDPQSSLRSLLQV